MVASDRISRAFEYALPSLAVRVESVVDQWMELRIGQTVVRARWVSRGLPGEVRAALAEAPATDVIVAPAMSPGAQAVARAHECGWLDERGGADFAVGPIVVIRPSAPAPPPTAHWTRSAVGVAEALLVDVPATVNAVVSRTGLSVGAATKALALLSDEGLLDSSAQRGRNAARHVRDSAMLLDAYFEHIAAPDPQFELRVGVVWRDPVADAAKLGKAFTTDGRAWAATSALAAAALAPVQTQVAPLEIYVEASSYADLAVAAARVGLEAIDGGGLVLRRFPSPVTATLSGPADGTQLWCAPWPRVYADLRLRGGVRGDDAADHLREKMTKTKQTENEHDR